MREDGTGLSLYDDSRKWVLQVWGGASLIVDGKETLAVGNSNNAVTCH